MAALQALDPKLVVENLLETLHGSGDLTAHQWWAVYEFAYDCILYQEGVKQGGQADTVLQPPSGNQGGGGDRGQAGPE